MENTTEGIACGGFRFYNNFDSANLAKVEQVKISDTLDKDSCDTEGKSSKSSNSEDATDYEFNLWTRHDCHGTQFQNNNRTWFYFGIKACAPNVCVRLNIVNLNKQGKMFSQGMCPVFKIIPGHIHWERIHEKPTYTLDQKGSDFTLSFIYHTPENPKAITYFAFTYPFSYVDLQNYLRRIDIKMMKRCMTNVEDVYYHRECAIKSLEGRRLDMLTISSFHNISAEREDRLMHMFPNEDEQRPFKFWNKKIIFISARVHPGETPSSFVLNGFLNFILNREDQIARHLRRLYVFKLIPMLNPDGVARGHYRMDTMGVNLNRVYLNPSEKDHPTIYAARKLIKYYHGTYELPEETCDERLDMNLKEDETNVVIMDPSASLPNVVTLMTLDEKHKAEQDIFQNCALTQGTLNTLPHGETKESHNEVEEFHTTEKGVFMYGNYFEDSEDTINCMLLPKLMSINNPNFHFTSCNFAERNMYIIDKRDGMSREGSGRVAVYKLTGLIRSYTLECNYNSGRLVNIVPARVRDGVNKNIAYMFVPPKYTPGVFEAVGAALGPSILDLTNSNPNSRLPNSQYRSLRGVKSFLRLTYVNNLAAPFGKSLHKGDNGIVSQDLYNLKGIDSQISDSSIEVQNTLKSDTNISKKSCTVHRSTSLYTTVKRIKNNKKSHQTINRKPLNNQYVNNIPENSKISAFKAETGKPFSKAVSYHGSKNSNVGYVKDSSLEDGETSSTSVSGKVKPKSTSRLLFLCGAQNKGIRNRARKLNKVKKDSLPT
ncbi:hypothetical protein KM043_002534 [Ampulex compressa]|nr:hypothetical protein KM043_002534 [Ampulex compressa]